MSFVWALRWYVFGLLCAVFLLAFGQCVDFRYTGSSEGYGEVAWAYIAFAGAILSLLYPLALSVRESLTRRLFDSYVKWKKKWPEREELFQARAWLPMQNFRQDLFDRQLPTLAGFALFTVSRVLLCLLNRGPLKLDDQRIEPQVYAIGYVLWALWVAISISRFRPFFAVEWAETQVNDLPPFEPTVGQNPLGKGWSAFRRLLHRPTHP